MSNGLTKLYARAIILTRRLRTSGARTAAPTGTHAARTRREDGEREPNGSDTVDAAQRRGAPDVCASGRRAAAGACAELGLAACPLSFYYRRTSARTARGQYTRLTPV